MLLSETGRVESKTCPITGPSVRAGGEIISQNALVF